MTRSNDIPTWKTYTAVYVGYGLDHKGLLSSVVHFEYGVLSSRPLPRVNAYHLIQRRAKDLLGVYF